MTKSIKIEDYMKQHNIQNLLREITHTIVQKRPVDPAIAIVQYLEKKFPTSFKNSAIATVTDPKVRADVSQSQSFTSPRSDVDIQSSNVFNVRRRSSNISQTSTTIPTLPSGNSLFGGILKQNLSDSTGLPVDVVKNLVLANRVGQHIVKLGKDIKSDQDIIDEELWKVTKPSKKSETREYLTANVGSEETSFEQPYEEPTVRQLIKYKQNIHTENKRRRHREELAKIAKEAHDKEQTVYSGLKQMADDHSSSNISEKHVTEAMARHIPKSKEEEDILNDEDISQSKRQKFREIPRNRNAYHTGTQSMRSLDGTIKRESDVSVPIIQFIVCKLCGNTQNNEENQLKVVAEHISTMPTDGLFNSQAMMSTNYTAADDDDNVLNDWFQESQSSPNRDNVSAYVNDNITPDVNKMNPFQDQIKTTSSDSSNETKNSSSTTANTNENDMKNTKRRSTQRLSESQVFMSTGEVKLRRSSSTRSSPPLTPRRSQSNVLDNSNDPLSKDMTFSENNPESHVSSTIFRHRERRSSSRSSQRRLNN